MAETGLNTDGAAPLENMLDASLRDIGIPPRPQVLDRIQHEMQQETPDFNRLANHISSDVSLAAGLIKTANSPYFGFRTRARTVSQALMMLGLDLSARAVAGLILRKVFGTGPAMERFWDSSARIARVSGWLAQQFERRDGVAPEDAYTFGLFRDCGIPILLRRFPTYAETLRLANNDPKRSFTEVESERHPTHHTLVGSMLAQSWWMPEETCLAIRHHHESAAIRRPGNGQPGATARMIALTQLAELCVQHATHRAQTHEWDKLGEACLDRLQLLEIEIPELLNRAVPVALAED